MTALQQPESLTLRRRPRIGHPRADAGGEEQVLVGGHPNPVQVELLATVAGVQPRHVPRRPRSLPERKGPHSDALPDYSLACPTSPSIQAVSRV